MAFSAYKDTFDTLLGVKSTPNEHEKMLVGRAQKYIHHLMWIPGIEMIAIVNSLSMFATHPDSDIDLFIITRPRRIWLVRFLITMQFLLQKVWRKGNAVRGNFCLSFFITTEAMDLSKISISHDIYLYFWVYYMKPIIARGRIYEQFLKANNWVALDLKQRIVNEKFLFQNTNGGSSDSPISPLYALLNACIRCFFLPYTKRSYRLLGKPEGVIIADTILKFHDNDRRANIRDVILEKDFDK